MTEVWESEGGSVPDHYRLDADPADNPHQPHPDIQKFHHPGTHAHVIEANAKAKASASAQASD